MELRDLVTKFDVSKAYFITKEILTQFLVLDVSNRKENLEGGRKKNKFSFVLERIKQICSLNDKTFTVKEVKEECEILNFTEDVDLIIEHLNFQGFIIKVGINKYKLMN